jgi:lysophospholipid acyltransferase (LPLAT)-like uncharacterized protein
MSSGRRRFFTLKNKRHMPKWIAFLAACLVRLWAWTLRVEVVDPHGFLDPKRTAGRIAAIWHNRLLFAAPLSPAPLRRTSSVLISASRDGEYVSTFIRFFDVGVVRGSSSRGGVRAFLELLNVLRQENQTVVLTVDGPRGPMYQPHHGIIGLAQKSGVPIMAVSINATHRWNLKSWDRMQIPWPFSKVRFVFGKPFAVPEDTDMNEALEHLRRELMDITED